MNDIFKPKSKYELAKNLRQIYDVKNLRLKLSLQPTAEEYLKNFNFGVKTLNLEDNKHYIMNNTKIAKHHIINELKKLDGKIHAIDCHFKDVYNPKEHLLNFFISYSKSYEKEKNYFFYSKKSNIFGIKSMTKPFEEFYRDSFMIFISGADKGIFFVSMNIFNIFKKYEVG